MAFTVYGPGIRDAVTLDTLFQQQVIEQTHRIKEIGDGRGGSGHQEHAGQYQHMDGNPAKSRQTAQKASVAYQSAAAPVREREPAILAEQIMRSPVVTLKSDATVLEAWQLFRDKRFRHLPVIDNDNQVIGLISDRDLLRYAALQGRKPPFDDNSPEASLSIERIYSSRVLTATPDTPIREIARILVEQRKGVMPIVDLGGELVGVITRSDILRTIVNQAPLELWV